MLFLFCAAIAAVVAMPAASGAGALHLAVAAEAQAVEHGDVVGAWTGRFLQRDWTFDFSIQEGRWSGRYMRSDGHSWQPLNELTVTGTAVSFSIESRPKVSFSLALDRASGDMSGTATIDGVATVPFSATRSPS